MPVNYPRHAIHLIRADRPAVPGFIGMILVPDDTRNGSYTYTRSCVKGPFRAFA